MLAGRAEPHVEEVVLIRTCGGNRALTVALLLTLEIAAMFSNELLLSASQARQPPAAIFLKCYGRKKSQHRFGSSADERRSELGK